MPPKAIEMSRISTSGLRPALKAETVDVVDVC